MHILVLLKFTPLEFETNLDKARHTEFRALKFTPLEFETHDNSVYHIYVLMLKFTPLEFETTKADPQE